MLPQTFFGLSINGYREMTNKTNKTLIIMSTKRFVLDLSFLFIISSFYFMKFSSLTMYYLILRIKLIKL